MEVIAVTEINEVSVIIFIACHKFGQVATGGNVCPQACVECEILIAVCLKNAVTWDVTL
jgi:hypothetical protein